MKTPIVALTGNSLQSDKDMFFQAGADEFQTKVHPVAIHLSPASVATLMPLLSYYYPLNYSFKCFTFTRHSGRIQLFVCGPVCFLFGGTMRGPKFVAGSHHFPSMGAHEMYLSIGGPQ